MSGASAGSDSPREAAPGIAALFDGLDQPVSIFTTKGVYLYVNPPGLQLVNKTSSELLGRHYLQVFPELESHDFHAAFLRAAAGGRLERLEFYYAPLGLWSSQRLHLADEYVIVFWEDITDRKKTEKKLEETVARAEESERQFRTMIERMPQLAWTSTADGFIDYFNPRWYEFTGTSVYPGTGATSWIIVPLNSSRGRTFGAIAFATKGARSRFKQEDVPFVEEIGRRASLAIENARLYRDATAAFDAERQARDKAEEATRLKDEFLATLSHELRTPLNAILGWARLLQSGSVGEEKRSKAFDTIVRNALAQNQLIEDLLDVSRIIAGKMRLNVDTVDIVAVIEAALDVVGPTAEAKGVRLEPLLDRNPGFIAGDAGRLQQIMWNLLSNAVKFTPRGGRVHVDVRREESYVEIAIVDTGLGIASDFLPYVFHRFRQQDGAITRKTGGLGLGLAIGKNLVELHGGTVEAHSEGEHNGSTFVVRIPIHQ